MSGSFLDHMTSMMKSQSGQKEICLSFRWETNKLDEPPEGTQEEGTTKTTILGGDYV